MNILDLNGKQWEKAYLFNSEVVGIVEHKGVVFVATATDGVFKVVWQNDKPVMVPIKLGLDT